MCVCVCVCVRVRVRVRACVRQVYKLPLQRMQHIHKQRLYPAGIRLAAEENWPSVIAVAVSCAV